MWFWKYPHAQTAITYVRVTCVLRLYRARYACIGNATLEGRVSVRPSTSAIILKVASASIRRRVKYEKLEDMAAASGRDN